MMISHVVIMIGHVVIMIVHVVIRDNDRSRKSQECNT